MKLKRFLAMLTASVLAVGLTACGGPGTEFDGTNKNSGDGNTLKIYLPGEYTSDTFFSDFEEEYGCRVIAEYFDSNEMMYTKLSAGDSYDILIPSDYMIERLIKEKRLQPLDREIITNFDVLDPNVTGMDFDPDNTYAVPYFWGSVGLVYNKNNVDKADLEREGWNILHDTKYAGRIYVYDSERDAFMTAFKALGYSMNTDKEDEILEAYDWLREINETMRPVYVLDEVIDNMIGGSKDIALMYSGDAAYVLSENPDVGYFMPNEGTNIWCDAMVITANAANPELANEFINYSLEYETAYDNTEAVGYTAVNADVVKDVYGKDGIYEGNEAYIPRSDGPKDEMYHDNEYLRQRLAELWIKVKAGA